MMLNAVIAEDELNLLHHLQRKLALFWPQLNIVAQCRDGRTALQAIRQFQPDVVFLDIQMGDFDGLQVAQNLPPNCALVFVTAYPHYALPAFDRGAVDYLLKPYPNMRLQQCIAKVQCYLAGLQTRTADNPHSIQAASADFSNQPCQTKVQLEQTGYLTLDVGNVIWLQPMNEVRAIKAQGRYVEVLCAEKTALLRQPFQQLLQWLEPYQFAQIHRGIAVNLQYLHYLRAPGPKQLLLYLDGLNTPLQVSRRFQGRLRKNLLIRQKTHTETANGHSL